MSCIHIFSDYCCGAETIVEALWLNNGSSFSKVLIFVVCANIANIANIATVTQYIINPYLLCIIRHNNEAIITYLTWLMKCLKT